MLFCKGNIDIIFKAVKVKQYGMKVEKLSLPHQSDTGIYGSNYCLQKEG